MITNYYVQKMLIGLNFFTLKKIEDLFDKYLTINQNILKCINTNEHGKNI
jgi:hypothetical protein